jgi:hypothetical protein
MLELIISVSGIYFCYGYYGVLQVEIYFLLFRQIVASNLTYCFNHFRRTFSPRDTEERASG